ncbi:MAG: hypothetical protein ACP5XB_02730 [Isosphaeraceae bacterium]
MRPRQGWLVLPALLGLTALYFGLLSGARVRGEDWVLPDNRIGIRTAPLLLLSRPDVQTDLQLQRSQILGAQSAIEDLTRRGLAVRGKTGPAAIAERRKIDEAQLEWLGKNLTGRQLIRLRQIEFQWEGAGAMLSHPRVPEYLKLKPEQQQALARLISQRNAVRLRGGLAARDEPAFNQKVQAVLTESQRELWANLLGSPVRFAATNPPARTRDEATQRASHAEEQR